MAEPLNEADVRRIVREEIVRAEFAAAKRQSAPSGISQQIWNQLCTPCAMQPLTLEELKPTPSP